MSLKEVKSQGGRAIRPTSKARDNNLIHTLVTQLATILKRDYEEKTDVAIFIVFYKEQYRNRVSK